MVAPVRDVAPRPEKRKRWPRRLLIAANILVATCIVGVAAGYGYLHYQFGRIDKIDLGKILAGGGDEAPGEPMNVLLVGSDTRATVDPAERKSFGSERQVGGQRSDTIIVLRIEPDNERAAMLSIPRDLWVKLPGSNRSTRINSAFEAGPEQLIRTINENLDIPIHHYVQVDFNGFRGIVSALGGVEIYSSARARDKVSGLNIPNPGCVELDGNQALALVRSRHYEYYENGKWRTDPTGDLGRIQRQQDFIRRVLKKANEKAKGLNVVAVNRLVNTGIKYVQIDDSFSTKDIASLANRFRSLDPNAVEMLTLPTVPANIGGAAVLRMKQPDATQVIDQFIGRTAQPGEGAKAPVDVAPNTVRVRVLNGSGAEGQARQVSGELSELGFNVAGIGEADSFRYTASVIRYGTGQRDKALLLQSKVGGETKLVEDSTLKSVDVVLITGGSFGGIHGAAPKATTTTAKAPAPAAPATTAPGKKATNTTQPPQDPGQQC